MKPSRIGLVAALWLCLATAAPAQFPKHTLTSIFPAGGQVGTTVPVEIGGTEIDSPIGLEFDHPGLRAFRLKGPKFVVAIGPGVPPGHHDVRIVGPLGVSNPRAFLIGSGPETLEIEPNNTPDTAQSLGLGVVMNGRLNAVPDVDSFAFIGRRGAAILIEIAGESIDSKLDAAFHLISPSGRKLIGLSDLPGPEPTLAIRLPEDGRYVLQVHDLVYAGSPDHGYRLSVREGPRIASIQPVPGQAESFAVLGQNLTKSDDLSRGIPAHSMRSSGSNGLSPWESTILPVTPAASRPLPSAVALTRGAWYAPLDHTTPLGPAFCAKSRETTAAETEPNNTQAQAQVVIPPCELLAAFQAPRDTDRFRFHASAGRRWIIEVVSGRIQTPADPEFVVSKIAPDGTSQQIATGDDLPDPFEGKRFPVGTLDPRVVFVAQTDGEYEVAVRDSNGSGRTDSPLPYRLLIRPERPDFDLVLVPNDGANPEGTTVRSGGRVSAYVLAHRIDGLTGPIRVEATGLPAGVTCDPIVIGTNQTIAPIVFTAEPGATSSLGRVRLKGRSLSGDHKEALDFTIGQKLVPDQEREAISGAMVWPMAANGSDQPAIAQARTTTQFALAVREGAPFQLTVKPASLLLGPGESAEWTVEVERRAGFAEAVQVTAADLPPKLPAPQAVTIAKDKTSGVVKLAIPKDMPPGLYPILFRGTGSFAFRKDPNAKDPANVNANEPANVVLLTIRK